MSRNWKTTPQNQRMQGMPLLINGWAGSELLRLVDHRPLPLVRGKMSHRAIARKVRRAGVSDDS